MPVENFVGKQTLLPLISILLGRQNRSKQFILLQKEVKI